jgi:bisphosphoglycerate-dependent phosphoglycerate mutase
MSAEAITDWDMTTVTGDVDVRPVTPSILAATALVKAGITPDHFSGAYLDARNAAIDSVNTYRLSRGTTAAEVLDGLDRTKQTYHYVRQVVAFALADAWGATDVLTDQQYDAMYGAGAARTEARLRAEDTREWLASFDDEPSKPDVASQRKPRVVSVDERTGRRILETGVNPRSGLVHTSFEPVIPSEVFAVYDQ